MAISESNLYDVFRKDRNNVSISEKALNELYTKKFRFLCSNDGKEIYILLENELNELNDENSNKPVTMAIGNLYKALNSQKSKLISEVPVGKTLIKDEDKNTISYKKPSKYTGNKWVQDAGGRWSKSSSENQ